MSKEKLKKTFKIKEKLPARIELATFRLRSERTTTMLRKQILLIMILFKI